MRPRRPATNDEPVRQFDSISDLSSSLALADGRGAVNYNGHPIDFQLYNHPSKTLIVTFHGAAQGNISLPWFTGRKITEGIPANWLALSDASLQFESSMKLSWFAGSKYQPELQVVNARIIEAVCDASNTEHLIFLGASGGGFAALEASRRFSGSLSIPMNPQTSIRNYYGKFVDEYLDLAWSASSFNDPTLAHVTHNLVSAYAAGHSNTIAYIQNTRDLFHISKHQRPFFEQLSSSDSLWMLADAWGEPTRSGHVIPPIDVVRRVLCLAARSEGDWATALIDAGFRSHR